MDKAKTLRKLEVKLNNKPKAGSKPQHRDYDSFQDYLTALAKYQCVKPAMTY